MEYISYQIYRKVNKYQYALILEVIKEIIGKKNIKVFLHKIEEYTGHKWNEEADYLVQLGTGIDSPFEINWKKLKQIHYYYK